MQRGEEPVILVFNATADTMAAEALAGEAGLRGALVIRPKNAIGNCGLALQLQAADSTVLLKLLMARNIIPAGVYRQLDPSRWEIMDTE
jgi:hypothetical protein